MKMKAIFRVEFEAEDGPNANFFGSFEQFVGRNDRMPLPSAVLRKVQMDI
jgi:hypothetical protein